MSSPVHSFTLHTHLCFMLHSDACFTPISASCMTVSCFILISASLCFMLHTDLHFILLHASLHLWFMLHPDLCFMLHIDICFTLLPASPDLWFMTFPGLAEQFRTVTAIFFTIVPVQRPDSRISMVPVIHSGYQIRVLLILQIQVCNKD